MIAVLMLKKKKERKTEKKKQKKLNADFGAMLHICAYKHDMSELLGCLLLIPPVAVFIISRERSIIWGVCGGRGREVNVF